ncbi:unnamed protein product [Cochlearia groenlandica]
MGICLSLTIFLTFFLLLVLPRINVVNAYWCFGRSINGNNNSYAQNRRKLFSNLAVKVVSNGGFYNTSLGQSPNKVNVLALCSRGYERQACVSCVERVTQVTQTSCSTVTDSFWWVSVYKENSVLCLVHSSNDSMFGRVKLIPPVVQASPNSIEPSKNLTLFFQQWEAIVNKTLEEATTGKPSSVIKYYSAAKAEFTEFPNVYMLMQCTPDLTSQDCKKCLGVCVRYFRKDYRGRDGGMASNPSCYFRWDLYAFHGAFDNVTRVPATPRPQVQEKESFVTYKKGSSIGVSILLLLSFIILRFWKKKQSNAIVHVRSQESLMKEVAISSMSYMLPLMDFEAVSMATNNFSDENKLGQGGFGIVYKGKLLDGKEIAIKRLSKMSLQGTDEFKNEVILIARLQHINLVRLLGCCVDKEEKMLIYEYLENRSLDSHLFDKTRRSNLNWQKRIDIINGIARGLLYLHQDSRFRIIHRDLKVSNILLDKNMTPKISDFGMARIFGQDETQANTRKVVGTYGYMSPEYAMNGIFSVKSDVFSFGVLLLEIISGRRSTGFYNSSCDLSLLGFVWRNWKEGKGLEIVDPIITDSSTHEILRCIQIGLLCVQERAEDRPVMSSVMVMFGSENTSIPQPKQPGFCVGRSHFDDAWSVNQITLSIVDPR